jgi:hypothetical protein
MLRKTCESSSRRRTQILAPRVRMLGMRTLISLAQPILAE